ncbi:MAG: GNAT family N-acetyltransferase [Cyanobacteria bacterium J06638_22]
MNPAFILRAAKPEEASLLSHLAMRSKAHWGYSTEFMQACQEELSVTPEEIRNQGFTYVVAETAGTEPSQQIIGFYTLERLTSAQFELDAMFVDPLYMGQGVGRALIGHAKHQVTTQGGNTLLIQSDPYAKGFYQAAGAEFLEWRESASIPGRFLPVLQINLSERSDRE